MARRCWRFRARPVAESSVTEMLSGIEPLIERYDGFLLDQFDVAYIYVGDLEREQYGEAGLRENGGELFPEIAVREVDGIQAACSYRIASSMSPGSRS